MVYDTAPARPRQNQNAAGVYSTRRSVGGSYWPVHKYKTRRGEMEVFRRFRFAVFHRRQTLLPPDCGVAGTVCRLCLRRCSGLRGRSGPTGNCGFGRPRLTTDYTNPNSQQSTPGHKNIRGSQRLTIVFKDVSLTASIAVSIVPGMAAVCDLIVWRVFVFRIFVHKFITACRRLFAQQCSDESPLFQLTVTLSARPPSVQCGGLSTAPVELGCHCPCDAEAVEAGLSEYHACGCRSIGGTSQQ